jgi:beta-lactamase regulating signal transducer with metallopeptidase domain
MLQRIGIKGALFCIIIVALRLLFPFEVGIGKSLACTVLFPQIVMFLNIPCLSVGSSTFYIYHALYAIWLMGIISSLMRAIILYRRFKKLAYQLPHMMDKHPYEILDKVHKQYSHPVAFQIKQLPGLSNPLIFWSKTPMILLPAINFSDDDLFHILSHEAAHYYNGDFWFKIVMECLCYLYWWNPFVYLLKKQMAMWLEIRADLTATKRMDEQGQIRYLESVVKIAKKQVSSTYDKIPMFFGGTSSSLKQRILFMLHHEESKFVYKHKAHINLFVTIIVSIIICFSFIVVLEPYAILPKHADNTVKFTKETTYLVRNQNEGYDVYVNDEYFATVTQKYDFFSELPIYGDMKEVKGNESH